MTFDYRRGYTEISLLLGAEFPTCEVSATDMARLLIHENDTLRLALGLPTRRQVLAALDDTPSR